MATLVHGVMVAGLLAGFWDAGVCIVGILLDSLAAYGLWLTLYLRRRPAGSGDFRMLAKSFIGLSLGVWGFIAIFRSITLRDTSIIAASFAFLKYLDLGDVLQVVGQADSLEDAALMLLLLVAAWLLLVSLYFLAQILWSMPFGQLAPVVASVLAIRGIEIFNFQRADSVSTDKVAVAERNLRELALHVFAKGWMGALLMFLVTFSTLPLDWIYLGWSYAHDLVLRPWLWRKFGTQADAPAIAPIVSSVR